MNRSALALLLVLIGCHRGPDAVQARVQLDPELRATCIALDVLSNAGRLLDTKRVERAQGQNELRIAIFQGSLPDNIRVQARALWGAGCAGQLFYNGQSQLVATRFSDSRVESVTLSLAPPVSAEDGDGDGFISHDRGGPDCNDAKPEYNPQALEECDGTLDRNCDGLRGCDDATCEGQKCTWVPTEFVFTQEVHQGSAGACLGPVTVQLRDSQGHPVMPTTDTRIQLSTADALGGVGFYTSEQCDTPLNPPSIGAGLSDLTFYMRGTRMSSGTVVAAALGLTATSALVVKAQPTAALSFVVSPSPALLAGECSGPVKVRALDAANLATFPLPGTPLALSSTLTQGMEFFASPNCSAPPVSKVSFVEDSSDATFSYRGITGGAGELFARLEDGTSKSQTHTIISAVRRGTCLMEGALSNAECSISPPLRQLDHSFFVFQATTVGNTATSAFIRCYLANKSTLNCTRAAGDNNVVNIAWQVVELPSGVHVQHFQDVPCTGHTTTQNIASVNPEKTFVLFSASQTGDASNDGDFAAVQLVSTPLPMQVSITLGGSCTNNHSSLQVVELDSASVTRGLFNMTRESEPVTVMPDVEPAHSLVLSTYGVTGGNVSFMCNRMIRSEVASPGLLLSRHAKSTTCDLTATTSVSYERLTFPSDVILQSAVVSLEAGATEGQLPLDPALDLTRTLLLTSSQSQGGQGSGETAFMDDDIPGIATVRLTLSGSMLKWTRDFPKGASRWTVYAVQLKP